MPLFQGKFVNIISFHLPHAHFCFYSQWRSNGNELFVQFEFYYRLKDNGNTYVKCDDSMIAEQKNISDPSSNQVNINRCVNNTNTCNTLSSLDNMFYCKSYSFIDDWSMVTRRFSINATGFNVKDGDSLVINLLNTVGQWSYFSVYYTWKHSNRKIKNSKGIYNTPPTTQAFPVFNLLKGCAAQLKIPVQDVDNDILKCRFAKSDECGSCAYNPVTIDANTCTLFFPATITSNIIIEIQIEDFASQNDTTPMSSVPLQFAAMLKTTSGNCSDQPKFSTNVLPDGSCVAIAANTTYIGIVEAKSAASNISEIQINAFPGFTKSNLTYNSLSGSWYFNYSIQSPSVATLQESAIFYAVTVNGLSSEYRKLSYVINFDPPKILTVSPLGTVCKNSSNQYEFTFTTNQNVLLPAQSSNIRFHDDTDVLAAQYDMSKSSYTPLNKAFKIVLSNPLFQINRVYSILVDYGAVTAVGYCNPQLPAITSKTLYTFLFSQDNPNEFIYTGVLPQGVIKTRSISISYIVATGQVVCFLKYNNLNYQAVQCNSNGYAVQGLADGNYMFYVQYTTSCTKTLSTSSLISWTVDTSTTTITSTSTTSKQSTTTVTPSTVYTTVATIPTTSITSTAFSATTISTTGTKTTTMFTNKPIVVPLVNISTTIYVSNNFPLRLICVSSFICNIFCKLSTDTIYVNCNLGYTIGSKIAFNNGGTYTLLAYAIDQLGTQSDITPINFVVDTKPPEFVSIDASKQVICGSDYSPAVLGYPIVKDNLDPNPTLEYRDQQPNPCTVIRIWNAKDSAGNTVTYNQIINLKQFSSLNYWNHLAIPCYKNIQAVEYLKCTKGNVSLNNNLCNASLQLDLSLPNLPLRNCDFTITINWTIKDNCLNDYGIISQRVHFEPFMSIINKSPKVNILKWVTSIVMFPIILILYGQ